MGAAASDVLEAVLSWGAGRGDTGRRDTPLAAARQCGESSGDGCLGDLGLSLAAVTGTEPRGDQPAGLRQLRAPDGGRKAQEAGALWGPLRWPRRDGQYFVYIRSVFCVFKECSCGYPVSLSGMCVQRRISLRPLPCDRQPKAPTPALTAGHGAEHAGGWLVASWRRRSTSPLLPVHRLRFLLFLFLQAQV